VSPSFGNVLSLLKDIIPENLVSKYAFKYNLYRYTEVGNVHGRVAGSEKDAKALLIGSHLDTVRWGGAS
jgi:acetylornithine deacetylase/succinyl-diaminopimelate desuccinylase-like protein